MCRVFWGQHHEALLPFVSLRPYFLWTEVFPTTSCGFQASGVAEGPVKDVLCFLFWLWAVEDGAEGRLGNAGRTGSGDPPSILHNTSAACFIFNPVYTSCLHFCSFFFFPLWKRCVWFCPCERRFPDRFFFFVLTCMICSSEEDSSLVSHSTRSPEESPVSCATTSTKNHGEVCLRKACLSV